MPKFVDRLRRNSIDALSLFILPCLLALLPRRIAFALMKGMARWQNLYAASVEPSWEQARQFMPHLDERGFKYGLRLLRLTDQVDAWLTLLRSARWWMRHVDVTGAWPAPGTPNLFISFHWGAGSWIFSLLRSHGLETHLLARRAVHGDVGHSRAASWFIRYRTWSLNQYGCAGPIYVGGGGSAQVHEALVAGDSVLGMVDMPAEPGRPAFDVDVQGLRMRFSRGLVDLGLREAVPIVIMSFGLDARTGRRKLHIETLPAGLDAEQIALRHSTHLSQRMAEQPEYWQFWMIAPSLITGRAESVAAADPGPLPK